MPKTATPARPAPAARSRTAAASYGKARVAAPQDRAAALAFLQGLAAEISSGSVNLPCFPDVVIRIRRALDDPGTPVTRTVKIVGAEPRLAARLLQTANSVVFNPSGKPVTELRTAITRLGTRLVQSSAMAFAVQQMRMAPMLSSIGKPLKAVWEESIAVASICQVIARRTSLSSDEAFLIGLLHGIGRLYIMVRAAAAKQDIPRSDSSLLEMIDSWHPAIGKAVLENWGFPEAMSEAVSNQQEYDYGSRPAPDHADVLIVSVVLAAALRPGASRSIDIVQIKSFRRLDLTPDDCRSVLRHTEHQISALRSALGC
jgi:HD-like signal output (HDOD) protein